MMRHLYSLLLYLLTPAVLLRLYLRGRRAPAYRERWLERFGVFPALPARPRIWIHAVSLGETQAAAPLIRRLLEGFPDHAILVSTTTPTGSAQVRRLFGDALEHVYLPYDLPGCVRRFYRRVQPRLAVIMETEIWPNLYARLHRQGVPIIMANARLSDRSAAGYRRLGGLTRDTLARVTLIAAREREDARRFESLGAPVVEVTGNIKFDIEPPAAQIEAGRALREAIGQDRAVWIAASTHEGEDAPMLDAHRHLQERYPHALLILVPRHPERFDAVAALCASRGFKTLRRGAGKAPDGQTEVLLGDTLGELMLFYMAADVAFVGGSLVMTGGHNPLEPAALGVPVITGPHTFNFADIYPRFIQAGAALEIDDASVLVDALSGLFEDAAGRRARGEVGRKIVESNRGTVERLFNVIASALKVSIPRKYD